MFFPCRFTSHSYHFRFKIRGFANAIQNTASFLKTYVNNVFGFPQLSDCVKSILEGWETARKKADQEKYMHKTDRGVLSIRRMFINIGAIGWGNRYGPNCFPCIFSVLFCCLSLVNHCSHQLFCFS